MSSTANGLALAGIIEVLMVSCCLLAIVGHALYLRGIEPRRRRRMAAATEIVHHFLDTTELLDSQRRSLRMLPLSRRIDLLTAYAGLLAESERDRLHELAEHLGLVRKAANWCKSMRWTRRLRGARLYALFGGGDAVVLPLFDDRHGEVRAAAAEWAAVHPHPEAIDHLLRLLGDESTFCRFTVKDSLLRLGTAAVPGLLRELDQHDLPPEEALDVAARIGDTRFLPVMLRLSDHPSPRIRARVLYVLAAIGGPDALRIAVQAGTDDDTQVRIAAFRALSRLSHWRSAAVITAALGDPEWNVRKEAGAALLALGPPGTLLLRCATREHNPIVADLARYMLDLSTPNSREVIAL